MSKARYPLAIRVLHWIMAAIVLAMIALGWVMTSAGESGPEVLYPLHKSFGLLIFLLVSLRLVFCIWAGVPELPTGLGKWEVAAAKAAHIALYVLMIVVPLIGYAMSSSFTQSDGVVFLGITVPELSALGRSTRQRYLPRPLPWPIGSRPGHAEPIAAVPPACRPLQSRKGATLRTNRGNCRSRYCAAF